MSDWKKRIIQNDNPAHPIESLPPEFVAAIRKSQFEANKGWAPDADDLIDRRVTICGKCGAPGMNTCWGVWGFTCGAEVFPDGEVCEPCCSPIPARPKEPPG